MKEGKCPPLVYVISTRKNELVIDSPAGWAITRSLPPIKPGKTIKLTRSHTTAVGAGLTFIIDTPANGNAKTMTASLTSKVNPTINYKYTLKPK